MIFPYSIFLLLSVAHSVFGGLDFVSNNMDDLYCGIKSSEYPDEFLYSIKNLDARDNFKVKVFTNRPNDRFVKSIDQLSLSSQNSFDTFNLMSVKYMIISKIGIFLIFTIV